MLEYVVRSMALKLVFHENSAYPRDPSIVYTSMREKEARELA